jgi:tetratricopeptide (TPR) repeat protein
LASLGVDGAYQSGQGAYVRAAELNPTSPAVPLLSARLEVTQNNVAATEMHLEQALTLKSNYTDAMLFSVQLSVAQNDRAGAIRSADAAARSAPGVASVWFQLGLLQYAAGNMEGAIPALERAVILVPDYANAKYFLGIAYYTQNRQNEGRALFEDLARTNPDSPEVKAILANMQAGKDALDGLPTTQPTEAPVAE